MLNITTDEHTELLIEIETSINYLENLLLKCTGDDTAAKIANAIKSLDELKTL